MKRNERNITQGKVGAKDTLFCLCHYKLQIVQANDGTDHECLMVTKENPVALDNRYLYENQES